jgi:hypothetical protein
LETLSQNLTVDPRRSQAFEEMVGQTIGLFLVTASKDIQNQVAVLRPGVQGNVGLGQKGKARDPLGVELMKPGAQVGQPNLFYCGFNGLMEKFTGINLIRLAAVQFKHQMISIRPRILDQELPFHGRTLLNAKIWPGDYLLFFATPLFVGFDAIYKN